MGEPAVDTPTRPSRLRRLLRDQRVAFLLVGGFNTALGFVLFIVFDFLIGRALDASAGRAVGSLVTLLCSYSVSIVIAYVLHRSFVFRVRGHVIRDFLRFLSVYWVSIAINAIALPLLVESGVPRIPAQAGIVILTTVVSYLGHRYFSFRRPAPTPTSPSVRPDASAESSQIVDLGHAQLDARLSGQQTPP